MNLAPSESIVRALVISNDALVIKQVSEPLRDLAASTEVCGDIHDAIPFMSARKFEDLKTAPVGIEIKSVLPVERTVRRTCESRPATALSCRSCCPSGTWEASTKG